MGISRQLVVKFLGDSSQLQGVYSAVTKDAQKFDKEIKKHGVSMQAVGKIMLAVGGTITGAMAATVVAVSKTGVEVDKFSKQTGVGREEIQKLGYAALQEHASMEQLASGLIKLSKNMYDASMGTGEAKDTFDSLGISVKNSDGSLRNSSDVLLDVADRFKNMTNETEMSGAAMKIFGKSGAELVPFLRMGRDGIEELKKEAERLGIVMSEDSVKNMKAFDDSMTAVKAGVGGFGTQIASALIPYMNKLADGLKTALEWFNKIPGPIKQVVIVGTALAGVIALISGAFIVLGPTILAALTAAWPFIAAAGALSAVAIPIYNNWNKVAAFFMTVWDKVVAATQIAWAGIRFYILTEINLILKGMQALTGWIPGWGNKLKGAITAVENQLHSATNDLHKNQIALSQNRYNEHYNWMVKRNEKKNKDIQDQDDEANTTKNQKTKEQLEKEKKLAEKRENLEKSWADKRFESTHNELENLNREEEKALAEAEKVGADKADITAYYEKKRTDLLKEQTKKRTDIEGQAEQKLKDSTISVLDEIANDEKKTDAERIVALKKSLALQLELKKKEYDKEIAETEKAGASTANITKDYDLEVERLKKESAARQEKITKATKDKQEAILRAANSEYESELKDSYQRIADDEKASNISRIDALKNLQDMELDNLKKWYKKQKDAAKGNSIALEKLKKTYDARKVKSEQDTQDKINDIVNVGNDAKKVSITQAITDMAVALGNGEKTLSDIMKDIACYELDIFEEMLKAGIAAGVAKAWQQAGGNPFKALPMALAVNKYSLLGITALEAGKEVIRGLAEGGLTTGPSLNWIGEGQYQEAVLPLSDEIFNRIGEGIIANSTTNNDNRTTNSSSPTVVNNNDNRVIHLGRYCDKSGLRKLWRDLEPIKNSEEKRKGQK
jgi:hypothetical protein